MTPSPPDASVIICTYSLERWDDLTAAVASVQRQDFSSYELILVIDHNPALFERANSCFSGAIVVENKGVKGLSGARNAGLAVAKGQLIAFLDDDAIACPQWLARMSDWCAQPGVLGAGGMVVPRWLAPRPAWFPEEFGWVLGYSYLGLPQAAARVRNLFGGNMCFHREVFDGIGGFRTEIGRVNQVPVGCEETELCIRALQHWPECRFIYEPRIRILHKTPPSRANWRYFRARCFSEGLSKARVAQFVGAKDGLGTERTYTFQTLPKGVAKGLSDAFSGRDPFGLARSGAILAGLGFTTAGYLLGFASIQIERFR